MSSGVIIPENIISCQNVTSSLSGFLEECAPTITDILWDMHFMLFDRLELCTRKKFALVHKSAKNLAKFNFQWSLIFTNLIVNTFELYKTPVNLEYQTRF